MEASSTTVVLLSGWKGSGKDTFADDLCKNHGFTKKAFADALKEYTANKHDLPLHFFHDQKLKEIPFGALPVVAKDEFSLQIQSRLIDHFRTLSGEKPESLCLVIRSEGGELYYKGSKLYWTPRALAIAEGSLKRSIDPNYWVKEVYRNCKARKVVISDWRYPNEYEAVKNYFGGKIIRVRLDVKKENHAKDESERSLDDYAEFDVRITNRMDGAGKFVIIAYSLLKPHLDRFE